MNSCIRVILLFVNVTKIRPPKPKRKAYPRGTGAEIARRLGVSRSFVARVIKGRDRSQRVEAALVALAEEK